jgi:hypothetical protein
VLKILSILASICLLPLSLLHGSFADPESQIVIIADFISSDTARTLIEFYKGERKDLKQHLDNELSFFSSTNPSIKNLVSAISAEILKVMQYSYDLKGKKYLADHCALYARIPGNFCPYHADNIYFSCPVHGSDQNRLRSVCKGECPGSKYLPNHTPWREYTALLYLNDDFEGGEIQFEDGPCNKLYTRKIPIKANMLVITPNGSDFYHEVFTIRRGTRYSLHIWYTSDPNHTHSVINRRQ